MHAQQNEKKKEELSQTFEFSIRNLDKLSDDLIESAIKAPWIFCN